MTADDDLDWRTNLQDGRLKRAVNFRLTAMQRMLIEILATKAGLGLSEFTRRALDREIQRELESGQWRP